NEVLAMRRLFLLVSLLTMMGAWPVGNSAEPPSEKLLLGFEEAEVKQWAEALKGTRTDAKTKEGTSYVHLVTGPNGSPSAQQWRFFKGKASQGDYAMGLSLMGPSEGHAFKVPADAQRYFSMYRNNGLTVYALNTCGTFRRLMPMDWSAYDRLRLDVYCEDVAQTIRVQLEDEEIAPPVDRPMVVKPGKWTTLEIALRAAEKTRRLDLKRMATLVVAVVKAEGKPTKNPSALLDNVRLSSASAPTTLPVVRDDSPLDLPEY